MELFREYGHIDSEGKFKIYNLDQFYLRAKNFKSTNIEVVVLKRHGTFSHQQRKYYFSVVVPEVVRAIEHTNGETYSRHEVDTFLRGEFLYTEVYSEESDQMERVNRRLSNAETDVSTVEFKKFIEDIVQWAARDLQHAIPMPNEIFDEGHSDESQPEK